MPGHSLWVETVRSETGIVDVITRPNLARWVPALGVIVASVDPASHIAQNP
jgi:hypothetical protein